MNTGYSTIRSMTFSDLLIGEKESFVKGMAPGEGGQTSPLGVLPETLAGEICALRQELDKETKAEFSYLHDGVRYRVSRIDSVEGAWYALRRAPSSIKTLAELGFSSVIRQRLMASGLRNGLVVFSGAMASGKTSSASALVAERVKTFGGHAIALESPPEHPLQGAHGQGYCLQREVKGDLSAAIVDTLRYAAPEIIFLGELRTAQEVSQALRAAINGHLVISTFHAGGVQETIQRLLALGQEHEPLAQELLADGLRCVIHQDLKKQALKLQFLFFDKSRTGQAARAKLRNAEVTQMGTDIQAQRNEVLFGSAERG